MIQHVRALTRYCEATWIMRSHTRPAAQRPYVYRARKTPEEVEEARLQCVLTGSSTQASCQPRTHTLWRKGAPVVPLPKTYCQSWGTEKSPYTIHHSHTQTAGPHTPQPHADSRPPHNARLHHHREQAPLHSTHARCVSPAANSTEQWKNAAPWGITHQATWHACPCSSDVHYTTCRPARGAWSPGEVYATAVARVTTK